MTKIRRVGGSQAAQKIEMVNANQGDPNIAKMQGTTRVIYDSVPMVTSATKQTLTLFQDCRTRAFPLTNLTENKLQKGESLTVQRIAFYIMECTAGTTNALGIFPLGYFVAYSRLYCSNYTFQIGQTSVLKQVPVFSTYAPFNPTANFVGMYQFQAGYPAAGPITDFASFPIPHDNFEMKNNIVIPVDVEFKCDVIVPPFTTTAGFDWFFGMSIEGLGSLYAPKGNF